MKSVAVILSRTGGEEDDRFLNSTENVSGLEHHSG